MKKSLTIAAIALTVALLTGCDALEDPPAAANTAAPANDGLKTYTVTVPDGRDVLCIAFVGGTGRGGISCDWEGSRS